MIFQWSDVKTQPPRDESNKTRCNDRTRVTQYGCGLDREVVHHNCKKSWETSLLPPPGGRLAWPSSPLGMSMLNVDGGEWKSTDNWGICGMRGVYIGCGIVEFLCQTKVNEKGQWRRVII
jgi:hypothetical protein